MAGNELQLWPGWRIVRELGAGSFGKVYEIHRQNGVHLEKAALKVIRIPSNPAELLQLRSEGVRSEKTEEFLARQVDDIRNEIGVMQKFVGYSNIVSYEDYLILKHQNNIGWDILIRMELLTALSDYMVTCPMTEELILKMGMDISQALIILHGAGIIHRDIKPQNIFINDRGFFKLGDFGISRSMPQTGGVMSFKGSVAYMAPETFAMRGTDARSDIYSLALVLHRCLNGGREPLLNTSDFTPSQKEAAQHRRLIGEKLPAPAYASKATAKVLATALDPNPARRFQSASQFCQALQKAAAEIANRKRVIPQDRSNGSGSSSVSRSGSGLSRSIGRESGTGTGIGSGTGTGTGAYKGRQMSRTPAGNDLKRRGMLACGIAAAGILLVVAVWLLLGGSSADSAGTGGNTSASSDIKGRVSEHIGADTTKEPIEYTGEDGGNAVVFTDPALEKAIQSELNLEGQTITIADAASTTSLDLNGEAKGEEDKIKDLTGLSAFDNLEELNLSSNLIDDLEELGEMKTLQSLDLGGNRISDLTPLQNLQSLEYLDVLDNEIASLEPISELTGLQMLDASGNLLTSIDEIKNLTSLEMLFLNNNQISDVSPLSTLRELQYLTMDENQIKKIDALRHLTNMIGISAYSNQIEDISCLKELTNLEILVLADNRIHDVSVVKNLPNLTDVFLFDNPIEDTSVLEDLPDSVYVEY